MWMRGKHVVLNYNLSIFYSRACQITRINQ